MELKDFVKTAINDITSAVSELQNELQNGAIVSPSMPNAISNVTIKDPKTKCNGKITNIDFDVATTVETSDKVEAGGGIGIQIFSAKIENNNEERTGNVSRIAFSIPVVLPTHSIEDVKEEKVYGNQF